MRKIDLFTLILSQDKINQFKKIAKNAYPNESAALGFGIVEKSQIIPNDNFTNQSRKNSKKKIYYIIKKIEEFESSVPSPVYFLLDDVELLYKKWLNAQEEGLKLICIFHSHPAGTSPSGTDISYMANISKLYPYIIWLIYGNKSQKFKAYIMYNSNVYEVAIKIE
ncbi:MAG: Mov34/MPN/PAD-1 family protein [Promethearchaeota archaeon]